MDIVPSIIVNHGNHAIIIAMFRHDFFLVGMFFDTGCLFSLDA